MLFDTSLDDFERLRSHSFYREDIHPISHQDQGEAKSIPVKCINHNYSNSSKLDNDTRETDKVKKMTRGQRERRYGEDRSTELQLMKTRRESRVAAADKSRAAPRPCSSQDRCDGNARRSVSPQGSDGQQSRGLPDMRPRTYSMPTRPTFHRHDLQKVRFQHRDDNIELYRVRSFSTTSKGIINCGDTFRARSNSNDEPPGGGDRTCSRANVAALAASSFSSTNTFSDDTPVYRVVVLGSAGVGKTSLVHQLMTSEYMGDTDLSVLEDTEECTVTVVLDNEETKLHFIDVDCEEDWTAYNNVDAYIFVFSITESHSLDHVKKILKQIEMSNSSRVSRIMVANKTDLVRSRIVTEEDGKSSAACNECKFIEVSAVLDHRVDELLVGIVRQIRLNEDSASDALSFHRRRSNSKSGEHRCVHKTARDLLNKFLKKDQLVRSCENLMTP